MNLQLKSRKPENKKTFTYLRVPFVEDAKNALVSFTALGAGSGTMFALFNFFAAPVNVLTAATLSTGMVILKSVPEYMAQQSLRKGRVRINTDTPPVL